ncbi:MAG TPA: hypothetical protein VGO67_03940 [Verrucomicrobiae bacterium]|jgi:acyl transferase domain-containing protein
MKLEILKFTFVASLAGLLFCNCGRNSSSAPPPLSEEEIPAAFSTEFKNSDKETQDAANRYVTDVKNHDLPAAFDDIQQLLHTPSLTEEQRVVVARSLRTTSQKLHDAADNGDEKAKQAIASFSR